MKGGRATLLAPLLAGLVACAEPPPPPGPAPELILLGGTIHVDPDVAGEDPLPSAIALQGGRVLAVGSDDEMRALSGKRTVVESLDGGHVYPGFTDAHAHLLGIGAQADRVDLMGTASYEEVVARVAARAAELEPGSWVQGRGWDQNDWPVAEFPHHAALSAAVPDHPAVLTRVDGHALLANATAMRLAGFDAGTPDPPGGRILREADGTPTGVFVDAAEGLILRALPVADRATLRRHAEAAIETLHRHGITALHDAGAGHAALEVYEAMAREGALDLRLHVMLDGSAPDLLDGWFARGKAPDVAGDGTLAVWSIKLYADGALGSRGALLLEDYSDEHGHRGLEVTPVERLREVVARAAAEEWQVCTHAIGDAGVRRVLDLYGDPGDRDVNRAMRWRVEHAQVIAPADLARFAALDVTPSMQPQHQTSDMPWAEARVGAERIKGAYAWRSLLDTGCRIPFGSDAPVERLDPIGGFIAAVSRRTRDGEPAAGWYPGEAMTPREALQSLTTWAAWAAKREHDLGRLLPGYRADLVVLDGPLEGSDPATLGRIQVQATVFDGRIVYRR